MTEAAPETSNGLEPFPQEPVKTGTFDDAKDFPVNLHQHIREQSEMNLSEEQQAKLALLRKEIDHGIEQAAKRELVEFSAEDILAEGRQKRAAQAVS